MKQASKAKNFHHPYEPYDIQKEFMNAVYDCIEDKKIGIFESPTGTGKSLSLICGSLTWLRDHKRKAFDESIEPDNAGRDEPDWMVDFARQERCRRALQRKSELEAKLAKVREKEARERARYETGEPLHKKRRSNADGNASDDRSDDTKFLLDDYESDDEKAKKTCGSRVSSGLNLSTETQALLDKLGGSLAKPDREENEVEDEIKIFFCSRTHSQLTQFVDELRKVKLPSVVQDVVSETGHSKGEAEINEELKHLTLGSRRNLCINSAVTNLGNANAINERCMELQQAGTAQDAKCKFLPTSENENLVNEFRDHALSSIRDIEDLGNLGKKIGICPYYASRAAIKPTEIVTLPYPLLLQKSAREALNISLKDHVVIIDEAHNLMDAITGLHSVVISLKQLRQCRTQLGAYLQKFRNRLKGKNRVYVTQLVRLIDSLTSYLETVLQSSKPLEGSINTSDLMAGKAVDQINLYKLLDYLQESKLARKVEGYNDHLQIAGLFALNTSKPKRDKDSSSTPVLYQLQRFLLALTYPRDEGRFFYSKDNSKDSGENDVLLKYLLLDPTYHFKSVVAEARAVILAGGTMSPMSDYTNHLFHYVPLDRMKMLSCGHVIPSTNLTAYTISKGPTNVEFDFTFDKRKSESMIQELGQTILKLAQTVPDGLVVFFPSHAYLDTVVAQWRKNQIKDGTKVVTVFDALESKKRVFLERKSSSEGEKTDRLKGATTSTDTMLADYAAHIFSTGSEGAMLFAVIGGSLSEGINFSDRLGRGIVVVGLPFPNAHSPEWKAKMEFIEKQSRSQTNGKRDSPSQEFYENTCMRAVNQSIGRAIRHKNDYAAILLLDRRYGQETLRGKLPGWIKSSFQNKVEAFEEVDRNLARFFTGRGAYKNR